MASMKDCIAFSWQEDKFSHKADARTRRDISQQLESSFEFEGHWTRKPKEEILKGVVQSIAIPAIIYQLGRTASYVRDQAHVLNDLSEEEREASFGKLGFNPDKHKNMLVLAMDQSEVDPLSEYIAASFYFTTAVEPAVFDMRDIIQRLHGAAMRDQDSFDEMVQKGLLVVRYPFNSYIGFEKVAGDLYTMLTRRAKRSWPSVFIDVLPPELAARALSGVPIPGHEIVDFVARTPLGQTRLGELLLGPTTKVHVIRPQGGN